MRNLLVLGLLLVAQSCYPSAESIKKMAPLPLTAVASPEPGYVTGVLPLDVSTMVYQDNNVNHPPTTLFFPASAGWPENFSPGKGLLQDEHAIIIDFPTQWAAKNLRLRILDGPGNFNPGQRYYAVARGTGGREQLVYTFTGSQYNEVVMVNLPPNIIYDRLVLRGPKEAQPARLEIIGDYRPFKQPKVAPVRAPLVAFTGVNAFPWNFNQANGLALNEEKCSAMQQVFGGVLRLYIELEKFAPAPGRYQFQYWNLDQLAQRTRSNGQELMLTFVHAPKAELDTWPKGNYQGQEIPDMNAPPFAYTADHLQEATYKSAGEAAYQLAARYGFNTHIPDANLKCDTVPAYPNAPVARPRKGLGYVRYYEAHNELDKDWKGLSHYMTGWQLGLYQSVVYDGAQGRLGPTCGVKTADPSAIVLNAGLAKAAPDAFRGMIDCWKKTRGYKADGSLDIPLDQWNYHQYAGDGGGAQHKGPQTRGVAPENSKLAVVAQRMVAFSQVFGGNKPVVLTETGYDVNPLSPLAAVRAADLEKYPEREQIPSARVQQTQGLWILRTLLEIASHGIAGITWYQAYDDNGKLPNIYQSCGLLNGDNSRRPAADFLLQTRTLMGQYTFRERRSQNPRIDIWEHGTARMAVLWLPVEDDQRLAYTLPMRTAGVSYTPTIGATRMAETKLQQKNGASLVTLSETPVFVPLPAP